MNITSTLSIRANQSPDSVFLQTSERTFTYSEWEIVTKKAAFWLLSHRKKGKTVAVTAANQWETLALFCGAARAGWIFMPFDPRITEQERKERLALASPSVFIGSHELTETGRKIMSSPVSDYCHQDKEAIFYSGFTSGSSGVPKQFGRSHFSWIKSFEAGLADFPIQGNETAVIAGPIHHSLFLYGAAFAIFSGQQIFLLEKFLPQKTVHVLNERTPFVFYAVPTMLESLFPVFCQFAKGLVFLSGAGWPAERKQDWMNTYPHAWLYEFYGASELSFVSYMTPEDFKSKPDASGKPSSGVEIEIRLKNKTKAAAYETGTVFVKSPMLFNGYAKGGQFHLEIEEDGFYTVGDAGYLDEDGYLYVVGREQFMIITGGVNVYPEEVERIINLCPSVKEAAVTSFPDRRLGEKIVCFYSGDASIQQLRFFTKKRISVEKIPRIWVKISALPRTSNGKIARNDLIKLAKEVLI